MIFSLKTKTDKRQALQTLIRWARHNAKEKRKLKRAGKTGLWNWHEGQEYAYLKCAKMIKMAMDLEG